MLCFFCIPQILGIHVFAHFSIDSYLEIELSKCVSEIIVRNFQLTGIAWQTSLSHCCWANCSSLQSCGTTVNSANAGGLGGGGMRNWGGGARGVPEQSSQSNMKSSASDSSIISSIFHIGFGVISTGRGCGTGIPPRSSGLRGIIYICGVSRFGFESL